MTTAILDTVILYSKPHCVQCTATKRALTQAGITFSTIDLTVDEDALSYVRGLGYREAPVVEAGGRSWSGFNPDEIKSLVTV